MTVQGPWPSLDKASAFYFMKRKAEDPGFKSPRARHVFCFRGHVVSRVKSNCSVMHCLSLFVVSDGFSAVSQIEVFSKCSTAYGNYILYKLK